jgi:hypothetical protein
MKRTTIMLPHDLRARITHRASELGVSMGEYIRRALGSALDEPDPGGTDDDALFADTQVFTGKAPVDTAEHHDRHLYGDPE